MTPAEALIHEYPDCYKFFGDHRDNTNFAITIEGERWTVLQRGKCWILAEDQLNGSAEVHWFCPVGVNLQDIRYMLWELFRDYEALVGATPTGHPNERKARVLNNAVGAEKFGDFYVLTKEQFLAYNLKR